MHSPDVAAPSKLYGAASVSTERRATTNLATVRIFRVLQAFIGTSRSLGATELAEQLGMTKNMVHRALVSLVDAGYLVRDHTGKRFEIGPGVLDLLGREKEPADLRTICHPFLVQLHEATGESAFLSTIVGRHRVNIDSVEGAGRRVTYGLRGRSVPLHQTITSRMLLAQLSDDEINGYLSSVLPTSLQLGADPLDPAELWRELREYRESGMGVATTEGSLQHLRANFACFALLDGSRRPHGAISIGGPIERFPMSRVKSLIPAMSEILVELRTLVQQLPAEPVFVALMDGNRDA